ncbi:MAG: hypothetical protein JXB88_16050 [Spirochaetales bacterium]|nr:hypothetical protein [Spirochaetales bacterium]
MVDSISIYTEKKIKIKKDTQIQIQKQKSLKENTYLNYHLFEYVSREPVLGSRAYGNIRDKYNRVLIKIDKKNGYCFFQFSLPFISSGENNLNPLTEQEADLFVRAEIMASPGFLHDSHLPCISPPARAYETFCR